MLAFFWEVKQTEVVPSADAERLERMRQMFALEGGILVEDYEHFTRPTLPGAPIGRSKARRKSVIPNGRRGPARS